MDMSAVTIDIKLNHPNATFTPGSEVSGQVNLVLSEAKTFRALKLRLKGRCKVFWKIGQNTYKGREEYFRTDLCLYGCPDEYTNTVELPQGSYSYAFALVLPENIPSSFEHRYGSVRYSLKAVMDIAWRFDYETKILFNVLTPLELSLISSSTQVLDDEVNAKYCCLFVPCINQGRMDLRIHMPRLEFACGDTVEAKININNRSEIVEVTEVEFTLEQKLTFHSQLPHQRNHEKNVIEKFIKVGPFQKSTDIALSLQVPPVAFSYLEHCNLIDIQYYIRINVQVSGLHCSTKKKYDIVIGTRPSMTLPCDRPFTGFDSLTVPSAPSIYATQY